MKSAFVVWALLAAVAPAAADVGQPVDIATRARGAARVVQTSKFTNASEFRRWCEADASRFDYPLLSARLVHHADELFSDCDATPDAG